MPDQELNDEMIEDISEVLDIVEGELGAHAFDFPLRASNALTAVRLVDRAGADEFSMEQAQEVLESIRELLDDRQQAHPDVVVSLFVRQGPVECRESRDGVEFVGGALLDVDTWQVPEG